MSATAIPGWAIDVVIALQQHADEHPKMFADYTNVGMRPVKKCGCEPLEFVPQHVKVAADAVAEERRRVAADKAIS